MNYQKIRIYGREQAEVPVRRSGYGCLHCHYHKTVAVDLSKESTEINKLNITNLQQPLVSQGLIIIEVSRSHSDTAHSVGPLWRVIGPTHSPLPHKTQQSQQTDIQARARIPGFESSIRAGERPQTTP